MLGQRPLRIGNASRRTTSLASRETDAYARRNANAAFAASNFSGGSVRGGAVAMGRGPPSAVFDDQIRPSRDAPPEAWTLRNLLVRTGLGCAPSKPRSARRASARARRARSSTDTFVNAPSSKPWARASAARRSRRLERTLEPRRRRPSHAAKVTAARSWRALGVDDARRRRDWKRAEVLPRFNSRAKRKGGFVAPARRRRPARARDPYPSPRGVRPAAPPARPKAAPISAGRWWRRRVRRV